VPGRVDDTTNAIPVLQERQPHWPVRGRVVTAAALHPQSARAHLLLEHHAAYRQHLRPHPTQALCLLVPKTRSTCLFSGPGPEPKVLDRLERLHL
jgi:hypothetical protein